MSLAAVAVRNQRRRVQQQQQQQLSEESVTQQRSSLDASDPNLKLRKIPKDQKGRHFAANKGPRKDKADENHANYRKKNKIDQLDGDDGVYRASSSANVVLYVGLGMISIGLVITFVGLGDKGFRTLELKLVGPSLVGCGLFFSLLRVLFCTIPSCCRACCKCCRKSEDKQVLLDQDKNAAIIGGGSNSDTNGGSRVGPSQTSGAASAGRRTPKRPPRPRSDDEDDDPSELESSGEFKRKPLRTSQMDKDSAAIGGDTAILAVSTRGGVRARSRGRMPAAKPLTYDNYSTDTSSQFSVDIVEVEPASNQTAYAAIDVIGSDAEAAMATTSILTIGSHSIEAREIVLNASRLKVESET